MVTIADPVLGRHLMSYEQFENVWEFAGIVMERENIQLVSRESLRLDL
jgi:hypothetical protein